MKRTFNENSIIEAADIKIGKHFKIGENVRIKTLGTFEVGDCTVIGDNCTISCFSFKAGEYLYMANGVEVGRGGSTNPDSTVEIGDHVGIFERTIINPNSPVKIGNDVGIGGDVMIWTHGAWLDITRGFPSDFGPVTIGNDVWLPARSIVLPNVTIGDNTVIGIGSIINRDIPSGCFAAGSPCKVLREDCYPREMNENELKQMIKPILDRWFNILVPYKKIEGVEFVLYEKDYIHLEQTEGSTHFCIRDKSVFGYMNDVAEDLRDFLRRNGIKIYTGEHFRSI